MKVAAALAMKQGNGLVDVTEDNDAITTMMQLVQGSRLEVLKVDT
jgi:hypothetical protein